MPGKNTVSVTKMDAEGGSGTRTMEVKRSKGPQYVEAYANAANVAISFFDFKLTFGTVEQADESTGTLYVQDSVSINMAPEHAKALLDLLIQHVDLYEKNFGAIRQAPKAGGQV
jgi:hypothetical protein